jgi:NAD(P)-dependent dehydrogenase (short-subunit alcohol dehydrogenase family)
MGRRNCAWPQPLRGATPHRGEEAENEGGAERAQSGVRGIGRNPVPQAPAAIVEEERMGMLEGKVAIVTGAAGGIGRAAAAAFVREGASVMLVDRDEAAVRAAAESLGESAAAIFTADVSDAAATRSYVEATVARFGGVDVLFANAGIEGRVAPITEYPVEELDRVLAVNVRGPFLAIQAVVPHMVARGGGSIVITSSVAGVIGSPGLSAYVASKHATVGLAKTAACELAPLGIRVNTVNPGPIDNRMMRSIEDQAAPGHGADVKAGFLGMVPMGRYGTNEEIAELAVFLAGTRSSYCTGAVFLADGGFVAR